MSEEKILSQKLSRRELLRKAAFGGAGVVAASAIAACATPTPQVIKETVIVKETVPVKEVVKETVPVEKVVTKEVEKVVTKEVVKEVTVAPTPAPERYNGYTAPSKPVPPGKIQLYLGTSAEAEKALNDEFKNVFGKFNPGVTVEIINVAGDEKLLALIAAGTPPDVWWTPHGGTIQVADGSVLDITDFIKDDPIMDDVLPAFLAPYKGLDGGLYGLPNGTWFWLIFYNKKALDEAKMPYPTNDWTWDDLLAQAQKLTKEGQWGFYNSGIVWTGGLWPYVYSNGGQDISEDGTRFMLDTPESVEAIQFLYDLIYKHKVMPSPADIKATGQHDLQMFTAGKLAMMQGGSPPDWTFPAVAETLGWGNFDVVVLPHPKGKSLVNWAGFGGFSVSAKTKNPEAAVELLKFLARGSDPWWPDPCYKSGVAAYVDEYLKQFPQLKDTHWQEAFEVGVNKVRFTYSSNPFTIYRYAKDWGAFNDRLWLGKVKPEDLKTEVPKWNAKYAAGLEKDLKEVPLKPAYKEALQKLLEEVKKRG